MCAGANRDLRLFRVEDGAGTGYRLGYGLDNGRHAIERLCRSKHDLKYGQAARNQRLGSSHRHSGIRCLDQGNDRDGTQPIFYFGIDLDNSMSGVAAVAN